MPFVILLSLVKCSKCKKKFVLVNPHYYKCPSCGRMVKRVKENKMYFKTQDEYLKQLKKLERGEIAWP